MRLQAIMTKVAWTMCVWSLVSAKAVAMASTPHGDHASFATAKNKPFDGILRFLAPEPTLRHHKMARAARAGKPVRLAKVRAAPARTQLAQAAPHSAGGVHVAVALPYPRSPYPSRPVPRDPDPPYAYAGPPAYAGHAPAYPPAYPYVYRYAYPSPYYVYYAAPWPYWPGGY